MSTSLLHPPPPPVDGDRNEPPSPPPGRDGGRPPGPGRRRPLAVLLVIAGLLGGGASTGILAATGALNTSGTTTTVVGAAPTADSAAAGSTATTAAGLNAGALYSRTAAGVVDITSTGISSPSTGFGPFGQPQQSQSTATGSGFVIDGQGHIVTAAHVVEGASSITVTLQDGTTRKATVLGRDEATDVAVLKIDPTGLTLHPLTLGKSAALKVGDPLAVIGDPFGYARSVSTGIVSGLDRTIQAPNGFTVAHAIQTDAAMNPGNSGGPVLDGSGNVIGISDQIATNGGSDQSSGVGFAVPIDVVRSELPALQAGRTVTHAYLGVSTSEATTTGGALVGQVPASGPADNAGLRAGDVITKLDSTTIQGSNDLVAAIATHKPGDQVTVTYKRGSQSHTATVTLGTQPTQRSQSAGG